MNQKTLILLGGATAVVAILAVLTLRSRESSVQATPGGAKLFPALTTTINDAASIEVKRKDGAYTLKKTGETWGLAEKSGYPVDMGAVRKCLIEFSQLTTAEAKTADPNLYSKIGVEDPGAEASTSALVTIRNAGDQELATLIVGKARAGKSAAGPQQVYVRKPGEAQSWLANGQLDLKETSAEWLDKKIVEIKRERVRAVEVRHADGQVVQVDRDKPETNDFTLHDIPDGQEVSYPSAPSSLGSALEWLNLEDVMPAAEMNVQEGAAATTKFSCFDGLTITVTTKNVEDKTYARFEASYEAPPEGAGPAAPEEGKADEDTAAEGEAEDAEIDPQPAIPEKKSREEVEKEAAELNARLSPWVYVIPAYNKSSFQKQKSELLKEKTPPPASLEGEGMPAPSEPQPGDPEIVPPEPPHDHGTAPPDHEHDPKPPKF